LNHRRAPAPATQAAGLGPGVEQAAEFLLLAFGQFRTTPGGGFESHAAHTIAEELVKVPFDLSRRELQHLGGLGGILIMDDGEESENEFDQTKIAALLGGGEFAVKGLALVWGYGKTEVKHLETPSVCENGKCKTARAFPDAVISSTAAAMVSDFQRSFFLRSIATAGEPIRAGAVAAHELGHAWALMTGADSNSSSLRLENKVRREVYKLPTDRQYFRHFLKIEPRKSLSLFRRLKLNQGQAGI